MPKAASKSSPRSTASRSDKREEGRRKREEGKDGSAGVRTPASLVFPFFPFPSSFFLPWGVCSRDSSRVGGSAKWTTGEREGGSRSSAAACSAGRARSSSAECDGPKSPGSAFRGSNLPSTTDTV